MAATTTSSTSTLRNRGPTVDDSSSLNQAIEEDVIMVPGGPDDVLRPLSQPVKEDELWDEDETVAQVKLGGKERDLKKANKMRKSVMETGLRMLVHMLILALYIAIHVHLDDQFKKCPGELRVKYFYGGVMYGGLWKYLSHICMWVVGVYFFIAFFTDIMPLSPAKNWFRSIADWLFTTITWPLALTVCVMFWSIFLYDAKLLREDLEITKCFPDTLNHALHTVPVVCVLIECVLVYHSYPSHLVACFTVLVGYSLYGMWVLVVFSVTKKWAYPIISHTTPIMYVVGMFLFSLFGMVLYYMGRFLASIVWKERFKAVEDLLGEEFLDYHEQEYDDLAVVTDSEDTADSENDDS